MVQQQQRIGQTGSIITEGRDVTTVVFPNADVKIYLDASLEARANRRHHELERKGHNLESKQVEQDTARRDTADKTREHGPLKMASDAIILDTTNMNIKEVVNAIVDITEGRRHEL